MNPKSPRAALKPPPGPVSAGFVFCPPIPRPECDLAARDFQAGCLQWSINSSALAPGNGSAHWGAPRDGLLCLHFSPGPLGSPGLGPWEHVRVPRPDCCPHLTPSAPAELHSGIVPPGKLQEPSLSPGPSVGPWAGHPTHLKWSACLCPQQDSGSPKGVYWKVLLLLQTTEKQPSGFEHCSRGCRKAASGAA